MAVVRLPRWRRQKKLCISIVGTRCFNRVTGSLALYEQVLIPSLPDREVILNDLLHECLQRAVDRGKDECNHCQSCEEKSVLYVVTKRTTTHEVNDGNDEANDSGSDAEGKKCRTIHAVLQIS